VRADLIAEELEEYRAAFRSGDVVEIADALSDLLYLVLGTYLSHGLQDVAEQLFDEVHRSNMTKLLAMVCLMVIVRRQWVEHERLSYPMVQLPLALIGAGDGQQPLLRRRLTWMGFAVPFVLGSINALHNYYGVFPQVSLSQGSMEIVRGALTLGLGLNPSMIGFSYFVPHHAGVGYRLDALSGL
jgi:hypothetical protein